MPILYDIMDDKVFGPVLRERMELGRIDGRIEGRIDGERHVVLRQLSQRFGPEPAWAKDRIERMSLAEIDSIAVRLLDARSFEDLLR